MIGRLLGSVLEEMDLRGQLHSSLKGTLQADGMVKTALVPWPSLVSKVGMFLFFLYPFLLLAFQLKALILLKDIGRPSAFPKLVRFGASWTVFILSSI